MEYQEKLNVDIEHISSKKEPFWRPIYEVIDNSYFEETKLFPTAFLNQCLKIQMNLRTYQIKSKQLKKKEYGTGVLCTSCYDLPKGVIQ